MADSEAVPIGPLDRGSVVGTCCFSATWAVNAILGASVSGQRGRSVVLVTGLERSVDDLPNRTGHQFVTRLRKVNGVQRRITTRDDGQENAFRNQTHAMLPRGGSLNSSVLMEERRQRQLEHDDLLVVFGDVCQQSVQAVFELSDGCRPEHIVAADFKKHDLGFDFVILSALQCGGNRFAHVGDVLNHEIVLPGENGWPRTDFQCGRCSERLD